MALTSEQQYYTLYSLADIQLATKNFDDGLVIGRGGFGKVYKGHINGDEGDSSTVVAIKRLDSMSKQGAPEFRAEIDVLSKLRHANLVSLIGCCDDEKEMIIVYEYIPNGTLYNHLHNSDTPLSWVQRLRIGIGAARGMDYLHTGVGTRHGIIHRDVKSSNILLDEDWAAKIADFGLAKLCAINQVSTYVHTGIKGTFGYLDPETFMTGKFTRKTDVFAFGVVLFELISGRRAILPEGDEDFSLARWAQRCVKERNLDQIVAGEIRGTLSPKSLKEFVQIAYYCLHSDPKERPTMSEIVTTLQLSLVLQEKFENNEKPEGLFEFTWKMLSNIFLLKQENPAPSSSENSTLIPASTTGVSSVVPSVSLMASSLMTNSSNESSSLSFGTENNQDAEAQIPCHVDQKEIKSESDLVPPADDGGTSGYDYNEKEKLPGDEQVDAHHVKVFSYKELKHATKNFKNRILSERRGWVYKGWVDKKTFGSKLAIMVTSFNYSPEMNLHELGEFCHPNILKVLGYCFKGDTVYLAHEFMEEKTLKDYLHNGAGKLPFIMRVKIVLGVTSGLLFLQHKQLLVKDWILDTNDIWLDKKFNAKLFHFDVARLFYRLQDPLAGPTIQRRHCDVNGLGLLLMEILTGKPTPLDYMGREHWSPQVALAYIQDLVDPRMMLKDTEIESARELLSLILKCTGYHYTMEKASKELEQIYIRMKRM